MHSQAISSNTKQQAQLAQYVEECDAFLGEPAEAAAPQEREESQAQPRAGFLFEGQLSQVNTFCCLSCALLSAR